MAAQHLQFSVVSFTTDHLAIKVKNISKTPLDKTLVIQFYPPLYLVNDDISEAAIEAAQSEDPPGSKSLKGIVTGPAGWSVWAKRETTDSSLFIVLINDLDDAGNIRTPTKLDAGAEFTIRIPLGPGASEVSLNLLYSYQHGANTSDEGTSGSLELKAGPIDWTPDVTLTTDHQSPTAITAPSTVKIFWSIKDGVSATLRGPLPGGNSELTLSRDPKANFKISEGSLEVVVVSSLTYLLQAEVKRPNGPNMQVVRMLWLDTANQKHLFISPRPTPVLPYGLIEIEWAAWGTQEVKIEVGSHTTRTIPLTQQTLGRFYEGSGVMRVSATRFINNTRTVSEAIVISADGYEPKTRLVQVKQWIRLNKTNIDGQPVGVAVNAPKIALLTTLGLHIAHVGSVDPRTFTQELPFTFKTPDVSTEWLAVTALEKRFLSLRRINDLQIVFFTLDGNPDEIPPLTLPANIPKSRRGRTTFDFVAIGGRAYLVIEVPEVFGAVRRAFSVSFNSSTKKAEYRSEPLLESMIGYRLAVFDGALYALNRTSGKMFRFDISTSGTLEPPRQAASAVRKHGDKEESMITRGLIVPLGRNLLVLSPTSVPSIESLEQYGLKNTLGYEQPDPASDNVPQDLFYNPQKDYWGRCGHDLDVQMEAVGVFRGGSGTSPRLWVFQPDGEVQTLAAGAEDIFVHDYKPEYPTKSLTPYITGKRKFTVKCQGFKVQPIIYDYLREGVSQFRSGVPSELPSLPTKVVDEFSFELTYNGANPAPATILLQFAREHSFRPDVDYFLQLNFSGRDLGNVSSSFRRLTNKPGNDIVDGTVTAHSGDEPIVVRRPKRFEERVRFVLVNSSKTRMYTNPMLGDYRFIMDSVVMVVDHEFADFSIMFDDKVPTPGSVRVNFNFALPNGIEVSPEDNSQTKLIRITNDKAKNIKIRLVKMLLPNDPTLNIPGLDWPVTSMPDQTVLVCQLDYER